MIQPRKLKSGRYQARFTDANGRQRTAGTFRLKSEAQAAGAAKQISVDNGSFDDGTRGSALFRDWAPMAVELADISTNSQYNYQGHLRRNLIPAFGDKKLRDISRDDVNLWWKRNKTKPGILAAYTTLRKVMTMATESDDPLARIPVSPCKLKLKVQTRERKLLETDDFWIMYDAASESMKAFLLITWGTSMRVSEALGLDWAQVDLKSGKVTIQQQWHWVAGKGLLLEPTTKNGKPRTVTVFTEGQEALRALPQGFGATPVLQNAHGGRYDRTALYKEFGKLRLLVNRPDLRIHDLRHSSMTIYAQSGATDRETMDRAGHSTPMMAMHYQHVARDRNDELIQKAAALTARHA